MATGAVGVLKLKIVRGWMSARVSFLGAGVGVHVVVGHAVGLSVGGVCGAASICASAAMGSGSDRAANWLSEAAWRARVRVAMGAVAVGRARAGTTIHGLAVGAAGVAVVGWAVGCTLGGAGAGGYDVESTLGRVVP